MTVLSGAAKEPEIRERTFQYGKRCLEICEDMGIPQVLIGPGWHYGNETKEEGMKRAADFLARLAGEAEKRKVRIATQHLTALSSNLVNSAEDLKTLLALAGKKNLEAVVDISILHGRSEREEVYWDAVGDRIGRIHLMDGREGQLSAHLAAGDGDLPLKEILERLKGLGYRGGYTWEINGPQYQWDPEPAIRRSLEAMAGW